jgi:hypothetical protein
VFEHEAFRSITVKNTIVLIDWNQLQEAEIAAMIALKQYLKIKNSTTT